MPTRCTRPVRAGHRRAGARRTGHPAGASGVAVLVGHLGDASHVRVRGDVDRDTASLLAMVLEPILELAPVTIVVEVHGAVLVAGAVRVARAVLAAEGRGARVVLRVDDRPSRSVLVLAGLGDRLATRPR